MEIYDEVVFGFKCVYIVDIMLVFFVGVDVLCVSEMLQWYQP